MTAGNRDGATRLSVSDLARMAIEAKGLDRTAPGYAKSIGPKYEAAARLLDEVAGKPALEITRKDVETLVRLLARAPKNLKQVGHRGTLRQAIVANDRARAPRPYLSPTTIEFGILSPLRQVFDVMRQLIPANPAAGVHPDGLPAPRQRKAGSRKPFAIDALNTIFGSPLYAGAESARHWHRYGTYVDDRSCRYWMPLLMLHTGLRAAEIVQLDRNSLIFIHAVPCLRIQGPEAVPVHPNLVALGLLDLFDGASDPLFPESCGASGATLALRSFNDPARFLDSLALKTPQTPIDALRLNFRAAVERVFSGRVVATLVGRTGGAPLSPRLLRRFVDEVDFGDIDFSKVRRSNGEPAWDPRRVAATFGAASPHGQAAGPRSNEAA